MRDEVDAFRRAAHEHDLLRRRGAQKAADLLARGFVSVGRAGCERVRAAMNVRVLVAVEGDEPVDHGLRLLGRRAIVEPHESQPMHLLLQNREIVADGSSVQGRVRTSRR